MYTLYRIPINFIYIHYEKSIRLSAFVLIIFLMSYDIQPTSIDLQRLFLMINLSKWYSTKSFCQKKLSISTPSITFRFGSFILSILILSLEFKSLLKHSLFAVLYFEINYFISIRRVLPFHKYSFNQIKNIQVLVIIINITCRKINIFN